METISLPEIEIVGHRLTLLDKILKVLSNATLNPAVATASGWSINSKTGEASQHTPTKSENDLGKSLSVISMFSPTNYVTAATNAAVKYGPTATLYGLGKYGNRGISKWARSRLISNTLNNNVKSWDRTVGLQYFRSPDKWYRVTETPELYGIKEMGKNVTTKDALDKIRVPSNEWRSAIINNMAEFNEAKGGWIIPRQKPDFHVIKYGSAHGNTTQAAKGLIWGGTFAKSNKFPTVILEGNGQSRIYSGFNPETGKDSRSIFKLQNWDDLPTGARLGFHTGEMPIEGLKAFQQVPGTYRFKYLGDVIPYKTQYQNLL